MLLKYRNISSKIKRSKVTNYAALDFVIFNFLENDDFSGTVESSDFFDSVT